MSKFRTNWDILLGIKNIGPITVKSIFSWHLWAERGQEKYSTCIWLMENHRDWHLTISLVTLAITGSTTYLSMMCTKHCHKDSRIYLVTQKIWPNKGKSSSIHELWFIFILCNAMGEINNNVYSEILFRVCILRISLLYT